MTEQPRQQRSSIDVAADLLVFAPVGLAVQLGKALPELAATGRTHLEGPLAAARFMGQMAVVQGRKEVGDRLKRATDPYFGPGAGAGTSKGEEMAAPTTSTSAKTHEYSDVPAHDLPIGEYDTLSASQVLGHLGGLSASQLDQIGAYEASNRSRKTVLDRISQLRSSAR